MAFTLSSMSVSLARLPRGSRLKDAQGPLQNLQAFVFGAIEDDVPAQHPANPANRVSERSRCGQAKPNACLGQVP